MNNKEFLDFMNDNGFNNSFVDDERFKNEPGSILCNRLREEMSNNPKHLLSLESALEFINFYGLKDTFIMHDPWMRLIGQQAIQAIDMAMLDGWVLEMKKS